MKNTAENIVKENLIKKYHEYGFSKLVGTDLNYLACEIEVLEKVVNEICDVKGIEFKDFILESQLDGIGIVEYE